MVLPFPLLGEEHPLRQHATGVLLKSALLSIVLHLLLAGGRIFVADRWATHDEFEGHTYVVPFDIQPAPDFEPTIVVPVRHNPVPWFSRPDAIPEPVPYDPEIEWDPGPPSTGFTESDTTGREFVEGGTPVEGDGPPIVYDEVFRAGIPPKLISIPQPNYPEVARDAGVQGEVMLRVKVGTNGRVDEVQVVRGIPMLNGAAIEAASRAVFRPAQHNERLVASWVLLPVRFLLS